MRLKEYDIDPDDVDADNIAASQMPGAAGSLTLTSSTVTLDYARRIGITSDADDSGVEFVITGTDADGYALSETIGTGPDGGTVESTEYFKTVTDITVDAGTTGNITVGTVDELIMNTIPLNWRNPTPCLINVDVTGTIDFTVQQTFDNVLRGGKTKQSAYQNAQWIDISALADKTADTTSNATAGATAIRLMVNSYTNGGELQMNVNHPDY